MDWHARAIVVNVDVASDPARPEVGSQTRGWAKISICRPDGKPMMPAKEKRAYTIPAGRQRQAGIVRTRLAGPAHRNAILSTALKAVARKFGPVIVAGQQSDDCKTSGWGVLREDAEPR